MRVTSDEIPLVAGLVHELCGVTLDAGKDYLIESRLGPLARAAGCASYRALCERARAPGQQALANKLVDAITTHETSFFRDGSPFQALRHRVLPDLIDAKNRAGGVRQIRVWSAACSTGQEVYSVAMIARELLPLNSPWQVRVLGTDISDAAIQQASRGVFGDLDIRRGLDENQLRQWLVPVGAGQWKVKDELRAAATFQRRNLLRPFAELGRFDIILCRNVAIYFQPADRRRLFQNLARQLTRDGCLFVGSAESLGDVGPLFKARAHCRATYYQLA